MKDNIINYFTCVIVSIIAVGIAILWVIGLFKSIAMIINGSNWGIFWFIVLLGIGIGTIGYGAAKSND